MNKLLVCLFFVTSMVFAQDEKIMIGVHYVGDIGKEEFINRRFNGIVGLEAKYRFSPIGIASFQGGLCLDMLSPKNNNMDNFEYNKTLLWNPNIGVELDFFNSGLKPFVNIGYAFYKVKYTITPDSLNSPLDLDPAFTNDSAEVNYNYNSITISPGIRYHFKKIFYLEANYKYLPVGKNYNLHLVNAGLGVRF